ncbi:hypothetical protein M7I_3324 [Glarea lozoyensis 74030]|uniref:Ribosomal RNA methyltransferase FtsJ domain-containing protein n=1 Tax=Glarea lozoyensis (strain ATCC 74030 / MF5533) TaxID=1104152 RepID=H0EL65_GLAL7|nr:hypothetical protein M7I_3324 [Glarea lozoyensis 74030]
MSTFTPDNQNTVRDIVDIKNRIQVTENADLIDLTSDDERSDPTRSGGTYSNEVISISDSERGSPGNASKKPTMVTPEELAEILEKHSITGDPREARMEPASKFVRAYLIKNEPKFVRVMEYRNRGWIENKEKGDAHFKAQRAKADQADHSGAERFYIMMQQIAKEMHMVTGALEPRQQEEQLKCLDICMAPGGYTAAVLERHPNAKCFGITLPTKQGGHPLKFAEVDSFKPARKHGSRSSFYMVAKNVKPQSTAAISAIVEWKSSWWQATFGGEDGTGERKEDPPESVVRQMLEEYGERLIEMGRPVWRIQADNLSRTDYAGDGSAQVFQDRRASLGSSHERTPRTPISGKNFDWGRARKENVAPEQLVQNTTNIQST